MSRFLRGRFDSAAPGRPELTRRAVAAGRRALGGDRRGVTAVEYAVVIGTLALAITSGFATLSLRLAEKFELLPL